MQVKAAVDSPILMGMMMLMCASFGCGSKVVTVPPLNQCGGTLLNGTVADSLTGSSIAGARVVIENASELSSSPIYNFTPTVVDTADSRGQFSLCSKTSTLPAVLVVEAVDQSGKAYPPTIIPVVPDINIGIVLLGACHVACGFPGQAQSSTSVGIAGFVTTSPAGELGTLSAQTAIVALDGSKNIWNVALEGLLTDQPDSFLSTAAACPTTNELCASYTYTLPSQAPVELIAGVYKQQEAPPTYSILAVPKTSGSCTQPFLSTSFQSDESSPLTAAPGKQFMAAALSFTKCH